MSANTIVHGTVSVSTSMGRARRASSAHGTYGTRFAASVVLTVDGTHRGREPVRSRGLPPQDDSSQTGCRRQAAGTQVQRRLYFSSTVAPASSRSALSLSASARSMPSLTGLGASSTSALASLRPRPVAARTTLMTWIFLSPAAWSTTSNAVCSSASSPPPSAAAAPPAGAAAATAVAETPKASSSALMRSDSSSTEIDFSSSIHSWVVGIVPPYAPGSSSGAASGSVSSDAPGSASTSTIGSVGVSAGGGSAAASGSAGASGSAAAS